MQALEGRLEADLQRARIQVQRRPKQLLQSILRSAPVLGTTSHLANMTAVLHIVASSHWLMVMESPSNSPYGQESANIACRFSQSTVLQ